MHGRKELGGRRQFEDVFLTKRGNVFCSPGLPEDWVVNVLTSNENQACDVIGDNWHDLAHPQCMHPSKEEVLREQYIQMCHSKLRSIGSFSGNHAKVFWDRGAAN